MPTLKFIISGGGTGGHIFPAIAIANEIKERYRDAEILFVGAQGKMEMEKVPAAGYQIIGLPIAGIKRSLSFSNFAVPLKLLKSLWLANKIIKSFKPDAVIGVGGYASAAVLRIAVKQNIPTLIQEQNSYPGITNKILGKKVDKICVAYPAMHRFFPGNKVVLTGNPVRKEIVNAFKNSAEAKGFFKVNADEKVVLVVGGSLGARSINIAIQAMLPMLNAQKLKLIWQTGKLFYKEAVESSVGHNNVQVFEFIKQMDLAYAAADVIVSRAGALAISELSIVGKPCILIPYPFASEDHQTHNAKSLSDADAAILIADADVKEKLPKILVDLVLNDAQMKTMSKNIVNFGKPKATEEIVNELVKLIA